MQAGIIRHHTPTHIFLGILLILTLGFITTSSNTVFAEDGPGNHISPNIAGGRDDPYGTNYSPQGGYTPASPYTNQPTDLLTQPQVYGFNGANYVGPHLPLLETYAGFASQSSSYLGYGSFTASVENPITIYAQDGRSVVAVVTQGQVIISRDNGTLSSSILVDHFGPTQEASPQNYGSGESAGFPNLPGNVPGTNLWHGSETTVYYY
jgi:hypothetical protein